MPGDVDAYIELRRGADTRRIPLWGRVTASALARHKAGVLRGAGLYRGTTRGQGSFVSRYRYPETPSGVDVTTSLRGPEQVFRIRVTRRVANFGVVVTKRGGSRVEPRVVAGLDENRLTGIAGLPVNHNPYLDNFLEPSSRLVRSPRCRAATPSSSTAPDEPEPAPTPSATGSTT